MKQLFRAIYNIIPFKHAFFQLIRALFKPGKNIYQHLHFKGIISVDLYGKAMVKLYHFGQIIENSIFWEGIENGWEKHSLKLWSQLAEDANVIFDIGANTGLFSVVANGVNPKAKIYAFEPVERVVEKLNKNIGINKIDAVVESLALSNDNGEAIIYDTMDEHTLSVTVNKNLNRHLESEKITIPIERLDSYVERNNIQSIDLIKMDVEFHEPEVIEGMGAYLAKFKPTMLVEIINDEVAEKVDQCIHGLDYLIFNINEETGAINQLTKVEKSTHFNLLFCDYEVASKMKLL